MVLDTSAGVASAPLQPRPPTCPRPLATAAKMGLSGGTALYGAGAAVAGAEGAIAAPMRPRPPTGSRPVAPPGQMAAPEILPLNSFAVSVKWTPPADLHARRAPRVVLAAAGRDIVAASEGAQNLPVTGYRLRYLFRAPGSKERVEYADCEQTWPHDANHATLTWLTGGKEYVFEVAAFNATGQGPWSDASEPYLMPVDTWPAAEPRAPPTFLSEKPDSIELQWKFPCHRGSEILSYDILCSEDPNFSDGKTTQVAIHGVHSSLKVDSLRPNTVYYFKYRAVNAKGASPWSLPTAGAGTAALPPLRPAAPKRLGEASTWRPFEISLKWEAPESFNIPVRHYRVRRSLSEDMRDAFEISIGGGPAGAVAINEQGRRIAEDEADDGAAASAAFSPTARRPGFSKGGYALTQLKVKGLRPGTDYFFQVMATNQIGESPWSPTSLAMRTSASPPERCERPRFAAGRKHEGMRIFWPVPESYGEPVTRYDVRVSERAMMEGAQEYDGVKVRPYDGTMGRAGEVLVETTMQNCWDPGVSHFYQVRAATAAGVGDWSESSEEMQLSPDKPKRPEAPERFNVLPRAIVVYWQAPESPGTPITGYQLRYGTTRDMASAVQVKGMSGTDTEFGVAGLQPHTSYFFQVCALNAVGASEWSSPSRPVAVLQAPPQKMAAPTLVARSSSSITAGFVPPADAGTHDGDLIQSYTLVYAGGPERLQLLTAQVGREDSKSTVGVLRRARPSGTEVLKLRPGAPYAFQVYAVNEFGEGEPSDVAEFYTSASAPDAPEPPRMVQCTPYAFMVVIQLGSENGSHLTHYEVEVQEVKAAERRESGMRDVEQTPDGQQFHGVHHLKPGTSYVLRARTANSQGISPWSEVSDFHTTEATRPEPVVGLTLEDASATSFEVAWKAPHDHGDPITEYCVQWSPDHTFSVNVKEVKVPATEFKAVCDGVTAGGLCYARAAATNSLGQGKFGDALEVRARADVPHPPDRVWAVELGPVHARMSWMIPYDCGSRIINFWLRYQETATDGRPEKQRDKGEFLVVGRKHFCVIEPLCSLREYVWEIAAENEVGVGPYSPPSAPGRLPPPVVPTLTSAPRWVSSTLTSLRARWNASEAMGSDILEQIARISTSPGFEKGAWRDFSVQPWSPLMAQTLKGKDMAGMVALVVAPPDSRPTTVGSRPTTMGGASTRPATTATAVPGAETRPRTSGSIAGGGHLGWTGLGVLLIGEVPGSPDAERRLKEKQALEEKKLGMRRAYGGNGGLEAHASRELVPVREGEYTVEGCFPGTGFFLKVASRNAVGLGPFGPVSLMMCTEIGPPAPIPQDPGISLLRTGITTLTFGWQRPHCSGAPITHYRLRFSTTPEGLWKEDCLELVQEEFDREAWPGMQHPVPPAVGLAQEAHKVQVADLRTAGAKNSKEICAALLEHCVVNAKASVAEGGGTADPKLLEETVLVFVQYLLVTFGALEESWEWLDVNGNGEVSREEFLEGDVDHGPPFEDFKQQELLPRVWDIMDSDGSGAISMNEYNKLRPYMEKVRSGSAGLTYKGVYCLVPSLVPGRSYHVMAKAVNKVGESEWTRCGSNPHRTNCTVPKKTPALRGIRELRTESSVTFRWELPYDSGAPLNDMELRYLARDVEDGPLDRRALRKGTLVELDPDAKTGALPTEVMLSGFLPGQLVFAVARAFNKMGGSREWSDLPGPGTGIREELITWDCSTLPAAPAELGQPTIEAASLVSKNMESTGTVRLPVGRTNGVPLLAVELELLDSSGAVVRHWETESGPAETAAARVGEKCLRRPFSGLDPGEQYAIRARAKNVAGASPWSKSSELVRMPPDVPQTPRAMLSEFTSLRWIELKWFPPHHNGAPIDRFEIAYALQEVPAENQWVFVDAEALARGTKDHGYDGRRTVMRDRGSLLYRLDGLAGHTTYYFQVRARNSVGWGSWSQATPFKTKAVQPSKVGKSSIVCSYRAAKELRISWLEPDCNGLKVARYDLIAGPSRRILLWSNLVQLLLGTTIDADKLFGYELVGGVECGDILGRDNLHKLRCEEVMWAPLVAETTSFKLAGLLPGQDYYFAVRAVNGRGKGEFSEIIGPFTTLADKPAELATMEVLEVAEESCKLNFKLPYNMGAPFVEAMAVLQRIEGPLAEEELHPETQEPHAHLKGREWALDLTTKGTEPPRVGNGHWVPGTTNALLRAYRDQGAEGQFGQWNNHEPSVANPTNFGHEVIVTGLLPGTHYQVTWACRNQKGWGRFATAAPFLTEAAIPDMPKPMFVNGM